MSPFFVPGPKPFLTELGIHQRDDCEVIAKLINFCVYAKYEFVTTPAEDLNVLVMLPDNGLNVASPVCLTSLFVLQVHP